MEKTPENIKPGISQTLTIRCELVDSATTTWNVLTTATGLVGRSVTSSPINVLHLSSIVIFKDGVQVASVTSFSGVVYKGIMKL